MNQKIEISLSSLFLILLTLCCAGGQTVGQSTRHVAYSLREVARLAEQGQLTADAKALAGISRVGGMVYDRENQDIILFGVADGSLPRASLDDLVVALRARLRHKEFPLVSIDPIASTAKTGAQKVRFAGGIEDTAYGSSFLGCDVFLKRHSLRMSQETTKAVKPYTHWVERDLRARLERRGVTVEQFEWMQARRGKALAAGLRGHPVSNSYDYQARFWFYVEEPYLAACKPDTNNPEIFCIQSLRICLLSEVPVQNAGFANRAAETYCENWTTHFEEMCEAEPALKRLKLIFDLTAMADAVGHLEEPDFLRFLVDRYPVKKVPTPRTWALEERFCTIKRSDKRTHVLRLSGGIDFRSRVEFLKLGDLSALRDIVIRSRPARDSVSWQLPVSDWVMPNAKVTTASPDSLKIAPLEAGCSLLCQSIEIAPSGGGGQPAFSGFPLSPAPLPELKGVSMRMQLTEDSFHSEQANDLNDLRDAILGGRGGDSPLAWPQE